MFGIETETRAPSVSDSPMRGALEVVRQGPTTASVVAARTGVPESEAAGYLGAFVERQWVEGPDAHGVYRATAIGTLLGGLIDRM